MKLVSFLKGSRISYGLVRDVGLIEAEARLSARPLSLLLEDPRPLDALEGVAPDLALDEVTLLPPIPASGRIICVGLNYKSHIEETGNTAPAHPILFPRYPSSLVGQGAPLVRPTVSERFDFEGELAFVIGKPGRHIPADRALNHVAGYGAARDPQLWMKPGDRIEVEIDRLGVLANPIVAEEEDT
jgi:2-keto-4-pentenoate hydratase/2-oxohepta-3-ene-1,7-dioic acid hydratase in catechol pathway